MSQTVSSSSSAYCSVSRFFETFDFRLVADLVRDSNGSAPTRAALLDSTSVEGAVVLSALKAGAGLLEAGCLQGKRYTPDDLASLTGVSKTHLERVNAGLALQAILDRRPTASVRTETLSTVTEANKMLDRLRSGEDCFGFVETQEAAQQMEGLRLADAPQSVIDNSVVSVASRYFGNRTPRGS